MTDTTSHPESAATQQETARRIAVSGASGLIGRHLQAHLSLAGHRIHPLVRREATPGSNEIPWQPETDQIRSAALEGVDAVVHLAGENVATGRWTAEKKRRIRSSRVDGTRLLSQTLARLARPPAVLVTASAVGFYGDRGDEILTEDSSPGRGVLAEVCMEWEKAAEPARQAGIRVVHIRIGLVLARDGGGLASMLTPFKMGLGGVIGSGDQWISWIAIDDLVRAIDHLMFSSQQAGPVNTISPNPVTNREFVKTLGAVLHRPTVCWMPATAARLAFGEMADEMLLASCRALPTRLSSEGFDFRHPRVEEALRHVLAQ